MVISLRDALGHLMSDFGIVGGLSTEYADIRDGMLLRPFKEGLASLLQVVPRVV